MHGLIDRQAGIQIGSQTDGGYIVELMDRQTEDRHIGRLIDRQQTDRQIGRQMRR